MSFIKKIIFLLLLFLYTGSFAQNDSLHIDTNKDIKRIPLPYDDCTNTPPKLFKTVKQLFIENFEHIESSNIIFIKDTNTIYSFLSHPTFQSEKIILNINDYCFRKKINSFSKCLLLVQDTLAGDTLSIEYSHYVLTHQFPWDQYIILKSKNKHFLKLKNKYFCVYSKFLKRKNIYLVSLYYERKKIANYKFNGNTLIEKKEIAFNYESKKKRKNCR